MILALVVTSMMAADSPPAGLACFARHYPVTPRARGDQWFGVLPDGRELAWDDGRPKTEAERLESPDLQDTLVEPYVVGPIAPITREDQDPGRIRHDVLFDAVYGATARDVKLRKVSLAGHSVMVNERVVEPFKRVDARLAVVLKKDPSLRKFVATLGGTFNWRTIAGTTRRSAHSWGIAVDLAVPESHYWQWQQDGGPLRWQNRFPQSIVDAFEAEGFAWGGRWYHYDTMHFEYRPELLDPACPR